MSFHSKVHCKIATLYLRDITINSVVRVGNYLDQKETMPCSNNYNFKQIGTKWRFRVYFYAIGFCIGILK